MNDVILRFHLNAKKMSFSCNHLFLSQVAVFNVTILLDLNMCEFRMVNYSRLSSWQINFSSKIFNQIPTFTYLIQNLKIQLLLRPSANILPEA